QQLVAKMESDIAEFKLQYERVWKQAYSHLPPGTKAPADFGPQQRQAKAFAELDKMVAELKRVNSRADLPMQGARDEKMGDETFAYYQRPDGGPLLRVSFRSDKLATVQMSNDGGKTWQDHQPFLQLADPNPY